tara:strand:+ start:8190 stop:8531 length:342 start_codon:yes stop_codon:yes gene_type:complete
LACSVNAPTYLDRAFELTLLISFQFLIIGVLTFFFLTPNNGRKLAFSKIPWLKHDNLWEACWSRCRPNPALWGTLAATLGFLPYVGPMIVFGGNDSRDAESVRWRTDWATPCD